MALLPDEIWVQILCYLEPTDLLSVQTTSKQLYKIARDASIWREKVFEKAPSAVHAFSNADSLTDLLNSLSLNSAANSADNQPQSHAEITRLSRRARAIAKWDCTHKHENVDWYSEYVARHAPLSTEWLKHTEGNEIRSIALFPNEEKILSAMEDGSLRIWEIQKAKSGWRSFREASRSHPGLLFTDFSVQSGPSASSKVPTIGTAIDSTVFKPCGTKAYVAVEDILHEVDLTTMSILSQNKYAWNITAISQQTGADLPLMVGTSYSLHMIDTHVPLKYQAEKSDTPHDDKKDEANTVFLPNYNKSWMSDGTARAARSAYSSSSLRCRRNRQNPQTTPSSSNGRADLQSLWAPVEPGPQTILHHGPNEIIVAGRMPSILFYDKRTFPRLEHVIHSGARLSSLAVLPHPPLEATSSTAEATLVAAGEYHGRGSLEIYELPFHRATDQKPSYTDDAGTTEPEATTDHPESSSARSTPQPQLDEANTPFSHKNRQSASPSKLLSVTIHGARIVTTDSEGKIHHLERNVRGLARRWNINSYSYSHAAGVGAVVGDSVARKILTFPKEYHSEPVPVGESEQEKRDRTWTRGDGDLLVWTGSDIGIVTTRPKTTAHDELVQAFEDQLSLSDTPEDRRRLSDAEKRAQEEEYARVMRRALERQADERRFLARFGRIRI